MPLMSKAVWSSALFFKMFLKESNHENTLNIFWDTVLCIDTHMHLSSKDSHQQQKYRWETYRLLETYQNTTELPIKSTF